MASRKVVELFYDVVSPYSWLGFEVIVFVFTHSSELIAKKLQTTTDVFISGRLCVATDMCGTSS